MYRKSLLLLIMVSISLSSCTNNKEPDPVSDPPALHSFDLATVEKRKVGETMKLPGQLAAFQEVSIFPKVNGYVKSVLVDIGSRVKQGKLIMILEAPELEEAVAQAKEKWARAKSDYSIDRDNYQRLKIAAETAGAISPMDLETAKAKMEADSAFSNAERSNFQMQQTMMNYLKITAPFDGVITIRNVHPGALVSAEIKDNKPMLELKELDHLRLQVDIPESISASLNNTDSLSFSLSAFPGLLRKGRIARRSRNISPSFRSERIELDIMNRDGALAPGMYAEVFFESQGNPHALEVPKTAVVTSTERKYVMCIREGKTQKIDVTTGNENDQYIEVFGNLKAGELVIAKGNDEIKEGLTIK